MAVLTGTEEIILGPTHSGLSKTNPKEIATYVNSQGGGGSGITALTGDVTASGTGSQIATIAAAAVTLAKQANLAANSMIGNNTASPATPIALNVSQILGLLGLTPLGFFIISPSGGSDTTNIQNAINAASTSPSGVVFMTAGSWNMGPALVQSAGVHIVGSGQDATFINFTPTNNVTTPGSGTVDPGTCFQFCQAGGTSGNILYNCSIENLSIASTNTSFTKNGIRFVETSQLVISKVQITGMYGGDSCGLQTMGHELNHIRDIHFEACIPIRVSKSPTSYSSVFYCGDHTRFTNCYLVAGTATNVGTAKYFPATLTSCCVLIDDGVFLSNFGFDGYQAWVGGQYGVYWLQPTSGGSIIYNIYFKNIRKEQGFSSPQMFHIDCTSLGASQPRQILFENCYNTEGYTGWYLRSFVFASMVNCMAPVINSGFVVDASGLLGMQWVCMYCQAADANSMGGLVGPFNASYYTGYTLPFSGEWINNGHPGNAYAQLAQSTVSLTDGTGVATGTLTNAPASGNPTKWIEINDNGTVRKIPAW